MNLIPKKPVGELIRDWRARRRLSQLELSLEAGISSRHLSFIETGRTDPSREMLLRLSHSLALSSREQNSLLVCGGFAPIYPLHSLSDQEMVQVRIHLDVILRGHMPNPVVVLDRHWNLLMMNDAVQLLLFGVPAKLLQPPVNVLRLTFHPDGLSKRILNIETWKKHCLMRLRHQIELSGDTTLQELEGEILEYDVDEDRCSANEMEPSIVAASRVIQSEYGKLSLLTSTTIFGSTNDVLLSELMIETFFPANKETHAILNKAHPA